MRSVRGEVWDLAWHRIDPRVGGQDWDWEDDQDQVHHRVARQVWEPVRDQVRNEIWDHVWDEVEINA